MIDLNDAVIAVIPQLRRYALSLTRDRHAADDLVQDVLVRAIERQKQFTQGTNLRAWLFTIMHNMFVDQVRKVAPLRPSLSLDEHHLTQATAAAQDSRIEFNELATALNRLPMEQRATLLLVALEGLSYEEAASVTGVAIGTVKSRVSRAREALRQHTEPPETEPDCGTPGTQGEIPGLQCLPGRRASH